MLIELPIFLMGAIKTAIQGVTGQKVDFVRTARKGGGSVVPWHYKRMYTILALTLVGGYFYRFAVLRPGVSVSWVANIVLSSISLLAFMTLLFGDWLEAGWNLWQLKSAERDNDTEAIRRLTIVADRYNAMQHRGRIGAEEEQLFVDLPIRKSELLELKIAGKRHTII